MINLLHHSTVVVENIEKSLHFYGDILGFKVVVDQEMTGKEISTILGTPGVRLRIVLLQVGEQETGLIGLLSFISSRKEIEKNKNLGAFSHALVFVVDDINQVYTKLKGAGEEPLSTPVDVKIPGAGDIKIFCCMDPNGVLVEFDQFIS